MKTIGVLIVLLLLPTDVMAGVCDTAWDGDKFIESFSGSSLSKPIRLRRKGADAAVVTVGQVQAFHDAKERISRIVGLSPSFIICGDSDVNAFAGNGSKGQVVGVTVGMLKLADGNPDMAAAVIGHEYAHHVKGHGAATQSREAVLGILGLIAGIALEYKAQKRYGVSGLGINLGRIGSTLVSRKFDRNQEREADQAGFEYMVRAGFNPIGAIQLANRMNQSGLGGIGLFFDRHPGWGERETEFRTMIASRPDAQRLAASSPPSTPNEVSSQTTSASVAPAVAAVAQESSWGVTLEKLGDGNVVVADISSNSKTSLRTGDVIISCVSHGIGHATHPISDLEDLRACAQQTATSSYVLYVRRDDVVTAAHLYSNEKQRQESGDSADEKTQDASQPIMTDSRAASSSSNPSNTASYAASSSKDVMGTRSATAARTSSKHGLVPRLDEGTQQWGYANSAGAWVIEPVFALAKPFDSSGWAAVAVGTTGDMKWGYINAQAEWLVTPQFSEVEEFSVAVEGFARVRAGSKSFGTWRYLSRGGELSNEAAR